jgi:hypothetical protein
VVSPIVAPAAIFVAVMDDFVVLVSPLTAASARFDAAAMPSRFFSVSAAGSDRIAIPKQAISGIFNLEYVRFLHQLLAAACQHRTEANILILCCLFGYIDQRTAM